MMLQRGDGAKLPSWWVGMSGLWVISSHISSRLMFLWTDNSSQLAVTGQQLECLLAFDDFFLTFSPECLSTLFQGLWLHLPLATTLSSSLVSMYTCYYDIIHGTSALLSTHKTSTTTKKKIFSLFISPWQDKDAVKASRQVASTTFLTCAKKKLKKQ